MCGRVPRSRASLGTSPPVVTKHVALGKLHMRRLYSKYRTTKPIVNQASLLLDLIEASRFHARVLVAKVVSCGW